MNRFIGELRMHGIFVRVGIDGDSFGAEFFAGAHDADGDLAAIGNENFFEHYFTRVNVASVALASPYSGWML